MCARDSSPLRPANVNLHYELMHPAPGGSSSRRRRGNSANRHHRPGDTVRQSGIYEVLHHKAHRATHEVVMISGDQFPPCESCRERVRFKLVRAATYIFYDQDFEGGDE